MGWVALALLVIIGLAMVAALGVVRVPKDMIGVVHRRVGKADPRYKVSPGGGPGPQAATLTTHRNYWLPPLLYRVEFSPRVYVPPGTIGVVVATEGALAPLDQTLSRHVECDRFQDARAFLLGGGQMGRQQMVLPEGIYDINPEIFDVLTVRNIGKGRFGLTAEDLREVEVPVGVTGVVVALEGAPPPEDDGAVGREVPGHQSFQLPWKFLANGGQRGAQAETLGEGVYRINPWFARVVKIPTRDMILEWTKRIAKSDDQFDAPLEQIQVNVEGYWLRFDMSQTMRIPARSAPRLVRRFGEQNAAGRYVPGSSRLTPVQRFVERVLGRTVESYFQTAAGRYRVLDFIVSHDQVRIELEQRVRQALAEWGVEAVRTTLNEFERDSPDLDRLLKDLASERAMEMILEHKRRNATIAAEIRQIEVSVDIAAERERQLIEVNVLERLIALMGKDPVVLERFLRHLKDMGVPAFIGSDPAALATMPLPLMLDLIKTTLTQPLPGIDRQDPGPQLPLTAAEPTTPPRDAPGARAAET